MPNTANVNFSVTNLAQQVSTPAKGITYMEGPTLLGEPANPELVISSWAAFKKAFGGLYDGDDFPLLCRRALDNGANLRINRLVHYTDPSDPSTNDGVDAVLGQWMTITFDAALVALNEIDITIDGVVMSTVTFTTDSDTTMQLIADELAAMSVVTSAKVIQVGAGLNREILLSFPNIAAITVYPTVDSAVVTLGASQAGITDATASAPWTNAYGENLFTFVAKWQGAGYNNFRVNITNASNGQPDYFNVIVYTTDDSSIVETFKNLTIPAGGQTVLLSDYLNNIIENSKYINVIYSDTTVPVNPLYPNRMDQQLDAGTDGTAPVITDYIGDSAGGTGLHAFDSVEDGLQLMVPNINTWDFHNAASSYVVNRKDLQYDGWAGTGDEPAEDVVADRIASNIDTKFVNMYYGLLEIIHPVTGNKVQISPMGQLAGVIAKSDGNFGEWFSYAGATRGRFNGVLKVISNFGTVGKRDSLQLLAQNQINAIINRDRKVYLSGNFTTQILDNTEKFTNVERLVLYLQKALKPTLETFLEDPNDPVTWKRMYYTVKPFLDDLLTGRAYFKYEWQGDQNVSSIDDVQINDPGDVSNGLYKVNLLILPIAALQEIAVNIIITPAGVSFEAALADLT